MNTDDVVAILTPIWMKTPETASRVRGRIERVLDAAKVLGRRTGENPARWRGQLVELQYAHTGAVPVLWLRAACHDGDDQSFGFGSDAGALALEALR